MDNKGIAAIFEEIGNMLDINGADFFRVNAYRKGALTIGNFPLDLRQVVERNPQELDSIPGIGKALKEKIIELVRTGKCQEHEKMKKNFPPGLLEMMNLRGVGPKKIKLFYSRLKITNIKQLKEAAEKHKLRGLEKMGEKSENEILKAIEELGRFSSNRHLIDEALQEAESFIGYLRKCSEIKQVQYAGSLRRWQETIGDIDIIATVKDPKKSHAKVMDYFVKYKEILNILSVGDTKSSVVLQSGIQVDLRVVAEESFGAALHYFTGDKNHNIHIRDLAKKQGLKVNEYGVFKGEKMIAGKGEEEVLKTLGLPFIIPEIREDDGEIDFGLKHKKFPEFIELKDIKADLHSHTKYSDGKNSIEEMAKAFMACGYEYFAVTDHSSVMGVTGGMGTKEIKSQGEEIDKLNKKLKGRIRILKGCEVDILKNGDLDFNDEVLKKLDVVIISAHMFNRLPAEDQTKRLIAAVENPYSMILAHPTGRLINKRAEMEFDMEKVIEACVQNKVALEINANPNRLDLTDKYVRIAKAKGAKFVINTDSHSPDHLEYMKYGVGIARRGWLTKDDVLNAGNFSRFDSWF
ncbi:DNA polymerase/3'-5' exonuclease PolX [Candidatus Peregrinibacteria bacterium]|nr:DNA polymerase/3'-5' exonuclease PolX [Candidatus Peregrinibacteria bacterium]